MKANNMSKIELGLYKHYKGKLYSVLMNVVNSETLEDMVVYQAQYNSEEFGNQAVWVRPAKMFLEEVEVDGIKIPRFKQVDFMNETKHYEKKITQLNFDWNR